MNRVSHLALDVCLVWSRNCLAWRGLHGHVRRLGDARIFSRRQAEALCAAQSCLGSGLCEVPYP